MTEIKIEVGRFYSIGAHCSHKKAMCLEFVNRRANSYYKFYSYEAGAILELSDEEVKDLVKLYIEEPKVGWVYDNYRGEIVKIIGKLKDFGVNVPKNLSACEFGYIGCEINCGVPDLYAYNGGSHSGMMYSLKLESGRPSDED